MYLQFPWPDMAIWSEQARKIILTELTVLWRQFKEVHGSKVMVTLLLCWMREVITSGIHVEYADTLGNNKRGSHQFKG